MSDTPQRWGIQIEGVWYPEYYHTFNHSLLKKGYIWGVNMNDVWYEEGTPEYSEAKKGCDWSVDTIGT